MTMQLGKNSIASDRLRGFVERIEAKLAEKKQLGDDVSAIKAEAKAAGFILPAIQYVLKMRAMKPSDRHEAETIADLYMHAMGMATDTPLFRAVDMMGIDITSREAVVEAMKKFVPMNGSIQVEVAGNAVRLTRGKDGEVTVADVVERLEPKSLTGGGKTPRVKPDVPDVDGATAEQMGRAAFKADQPVIDNPFPYGHPNRPRWDKGWREESGGDGMDD